MPLAIVALISEILSLIPQLTAAGVEIAGLVAKVKAVLADNAAPDDQTWQELDLQVTQLQADLAKD